MFRTFSVITRTLGRIETLYGMVDLLLTQEVPPVDFILADRTSARDIYQRLEQELEEFHAPFV